MKAALIKLIEDGTLTAREADKLEGVKSIKEVDLNTIYKLFVAGNEEAHEIINGFEDFNTVFASMDKFHEFEQQVRDSQTRTVGDLLEAIEDDTDDEEDDSKPYPVLMDGDNEDEVEADKTLRISTILSMVDKDDARTIIRALEGVGAAEEVEGAMYHGASPSTTLKRLLLRERVDDLGLLYLAYKLERAEKDLGLFGRR